MTLSEAIKILEDYQKWRLGSEVSMPSPKGITKAIDLILKEVKK